MSARQTEAERSSDAVCGTDGVGVDSDTNGSADSRLRARGLSGGCLRQPPLVLGEFSADSDERDPHQSEQVAKQVASAQTRLIAASASRRRLVISATVVRSSCARRSTVRGISPAKP